MGKNPMDEDGDYTYCAALMKKHGIDHDQPINDCDECPVKEYCEIKKVSDNVEATKVDEAKGYTENKAFLNCMLPLEGPVTRVEMEMVKKSVGRLWMAFWNLRRMYAMNDEEWARSIQETIEKYGGGLDTYKLKREAMEKAKVTITEEKSLEIVGAVRMFLESLPFTSTFEIPQDCETVLDLLTYFKYPTEQVILYILPVLGYEYISKQKGVMGPDGVHQTVQTIESITGEDNER